MIGCNVKSEAQQSDQPPTDDTDKKKPEMPKQAVGDKKFKRRGVEKKG